MMAIFSHKWLMLWRKKHIVINLSWHGGYGPLLSSFEVLEVPKTDNSSIVWRGLSTNSQLWFYIYWIIVRFLNLLISSLSLFCLDAGRLLWNERVEALGGVMPWLMVVRHVHDKENIPSAIKFLSLYRQLSQHMVSHSGSFTRERRWKSCSCFSPLQQAFLLHWAKMAKLTQIHQLKFRSRILKTFLLETCS